MKEYKIGLYEKALPAELSWKEKLELAKKVGYDYVEISIDETEGRLSRLDWSKEERDDFAALLRETNLPIGSMCLSGHRKFPMGSHEKATRDRSMEIMQKAINFAEEFGIRTIQLAGYDVYYEESDEDTKKWFAENLAKAAQMAARSGVMMGFETMETEFMNTVGKAMRYVDLVGSPYLGVYPDIGNTTNAAVSYGTDVLEDLRAGKGHLFAMHLKETKPGIFREVPFGTGHVNFEAAIAAAWELGIRRFVTEFWYTGNEKWQEDVVFAHDMMAEILDRQQ